MVNIATLSATIRLDNKKFRRDVAETKGTLGQLNKGLQRGAIDAQKFGGALAERFLGGAAAISLAAAALHNFSQSWKDAQLNAGLNPGDQSRGGFGGFLDATRDFLEGIPIYGDIVKLGGSIRASLDGSAAEMKALNQELARFPELEKRLNERIAEGRRKRQLQAEQTDLLTGTNTATRALAMSRADREVSAIEFRMEDIRAAQKARPGRGVEVTPASTFQRRDRPDIAERAAADIRAILETLQRDGIQVNLSR